MKGCEVEFVDVSRSRKFSYTGVRKIVVRVEEGMIYIRGIDPVTNEMYFVMISDADYDYFIVNKEDEVNE